jgi:single-stranded-DNA-specific exonuclease
MMPEKSMTHKKSILGNLWIQSKVDESVAKQLKNQADYPQIICDLIAARDIDLNNVPHFLNPTLKHFLPDPFLLKDMKLGVNRIIDAINHNQKITVYGDYDVDGATSTALLIRFFRMLGVDIEFYIPDRQTEGYGPNTKAFEHLALSGTNLIITVDCGTLSFEPIAAAKKMGTDVVVIDHHAGTATHPECVALINPNRLDETSPLKHLAAVGISFMVCVAVTQSLREQNYFNDKPTPDLISLLDIVALGTVCDVVALTGLNRAFVAQGLKVLSHSKNKGLVYLMNLLNIDKNQLSPYHFGFVIGPRINAGGRIGTSTLGTLLLSSEDDADVASAAEQLNVLNEERKLLQESTLLDADLQVNPNDPIIVVSSPDWHQGVIGIVAGKLKDKYHKPTFVIAIDPITQEGKASARSIPGFDIGHSIHLAHEHNVILQGGGHPMAGGFSLKHSQMNDFITFMSTHVTSALSKEHALPKRTFDGHLTLNSLTISLHDLIEQIGPFGSGNPTPKFLFQNVLLKKIVIMQEKHIRCFLEDPISGKSAEALIFNAFQSALGDFLVKHQYKHIDILGTLKKDSWQDRITLKIWIEDARPSS